MQNLKIKLNSESEAEEVKRLAVKAGYKLDALFGRKWSAEFCYLVLCENMAAGFANEIMADGDKPLSIGELWAVANQDQDEPFLTPETTLNDQYAEIEQVRQPISKSWGSVGSASGGASRSSGGVDATLAERQSTYGNFEDVAFVTENIMSILAKVRVNGLDDFPNTHRMALYMIASKMARIVNGDFNHLDSWHDIGGYAKLIEKLIKGE